MAAGVGAKIVSFVKDKLFGKGGKDSIVGMIIDRKVADKNLATELQNDLEKAFEENSHELEMKFMEIVQEAQTPLPFEPKLSMFLKGSTRWIIALIMTAFYIYLRLTQGTVTEYDQYLIGGIWGFLFLLRSAEKLTKRDK